MLRQSQFTDPQVDGWELGKLIEKNKKGAYGLPFSESKL
jgi:hypothetical protein